MPDKPLTVFTYAASASLAAVALVYFFHPNYLFDGDSSASSASGRKKGIVGLFNPANDCFINCNLQSLSGLGDLRVYLIRELHRRELGGPEVYESVPTKDANGKNINAGKLLSLQSGEVTKGLKDMIDRLNERPIYKKTISAIDFIRVLEHAFGTTISKTQQDAQELLQIVAERLSEEYHAGREARKRFRNSGINIRNKPESSESLDDYAKRFIEVDKNCDADPSAAMPPPEISMPAVADAEDEEGMEEEDGFPLEGQTQARVECDFCHFVPKAKPTSFVMLNLMVPQKSSSSLNDCFDAHFKTEFIDDYKCDKCRLDHAIETFTKDLQGTKAQEQSTKLRSDIHLLKKAMIEDPEKLPEGVDLPDIKDAPKRKIARNIEIKTFPKVLVIHLSRSIYDPRSNSTKNLAKVTFPEKFPVGGILNRRNYKLLGVVTHKGTHNSGHYETFRRQHFYAPYSNPHSNNLSGPYSAAPTSTPSLNATLPLRPSSKGSEKQDHAAALGESSKASATSSSPRTSNSHSLPSTQQSSAPDDLNGDIAPQAPSEPPKSTPTTSTTERSSPLMGQYLSPPSSAIPRSKPSSVVDLARLKRRKKPVDRWWRISDDKIKECKTSEVLAMTREVYMLFYEMERDAD